jgi:hypothetical protein
MSGSAGVCSTDRPRPVPTAAGLPDEPFGGVVVPRGWTLAQPRATAEISATRFSGLGIPSPRISRSISNSWVSLLPVQGRAAGVSSTRAPALWVLARPRPGRGSRDHDRIVVSGAHAVSTRTAIRVRSNKESRKPVAASGPFPMRTALVLGYTRSHHRKHRAEGTITAVPTIRHRKLVRRESIRLSNPMDPHRNVCRARSRVREDRSRSGCPTEAGRSYIGSHGVWVWLRDDRNACWIRAQTQHPLFTRPSTGQVHVTIAAIIAVAGPGHIS